MKEIILPRLGEGVIEAKLLRWLKKEGELVKKGDIVAEIATDKVDSDVISEEEGYIHQYLYTEGSDMPVGGAILLLRDSSSAVGESVSYHPPVHTDTTKIAQQATKQDVHPQVPSLPQSPSPNTNNPQPTKGGEGHNFISPLVAKMLLEHKIYAEELSHIKGSGIGGRISKQDILALLEKRSPDNIASSNATSLVEKPLEKKTSTPITQNVETPIIELQKGDEVVQMDRVRSLIAKNLKLSQQTSVHVTSFAEADVTTIVEWKKKVTPQCQSLYDTKLTFTPIFIYAIVRALAKFPMLNSTFVGEDKIIKHKDIHLGLAVAQPNDNLIVPVIKNALDLNLLGLARETNRLAEAAKNYTLTSASCKGGTFTVSNVGASGTLFGTPIINTPEVAILAIGAIKKRAHVIEQGGQDFIAIRSMLYLSLSYDHRIVDGNAGGMFLKEIIQQLESFDANTKLT